MPQKQRDATSAGDHQRGRTNDCRGAERRTGGDDLDKRLALG
jgi:hypothetical protein